MSKKTDSRSRSRSASRSHSDSRSRSRSQSTSRSRSRKRRYGSRSRSRSHSPPHNRERNHTREYQNQREFRGNYRGFRRPYYFRGRGQGYFRGRFQRGGWGGYNNYRPKNWQNFRQNYPQHQQQQQYPNSPKRGRSRSRSPKKQLSSPQSRSHSRRSDRSSSGRSPQSHASSCSNSGSAKRNKDVRENVPASKKTPNRGEGDGALAEVGKSDGDRTLENGQDLTNNDISPKRTQVCSSVTLCHGDSVMNESSPAHKSSNASTNGAAAWQNVVTATATKSPKKISPTQGFNGFGILGNVDQDDTIAISAAFLKFLEEQKLKKQTPAWENNTNNDKNPDNAEEKEKYKKSCEGDMPSISGTQRPFLCEEDDEEMEISNKMRHMETNPSKSTKVTLSAREMFEERIRRLQDMALDDELEALLVSHKQERAANILAALSKREQLGGTFKDPSHERLSKVKRKEKNTMETSKSSQMSRRSSENREQEMFVVMSEESSPRASAKKGTEFSVRMDELARSSVLINERRNILDFLHLDKKDWDLHSVLQHLHAQQSLRSPSELFAQHIVSIIHHIKAHYFPSTGMTLNDRFAMYQRRAAEKELMKQRKSPEIHRIIDVPPSAFKKHALLFDEMKNSMENSFKVDGKQYKGDSVDLRLDIERRKKYVAKERGHREDEDGGRVLRESPDTSKETSTQKAANNNKSLKRKKKKRERSQSSSSSSSSSSIDREEDAEMKAESLVKARLGFREPFERGRLRGGFQLRIRGRSWNRGNFHGNSNGKDAQMHMSMKNEGWDPEYTPKSKKYFQHSERDVEGERKLMQMQGRGRGNVMRGKGRFILRRATNTNATNNTSPKWAHDKFQPTDDEGEQQGEDVKQDHKK
ncbi:thyroid hormone receptor-associated protein 3 isoform X3 [Triplophysa dalaica]|uniref:thyroid hormone receptor-associated protein 3 isoform X3 n=1 Tax=Triplophysa dalaica TaxID=1582913 RepID=UPI0024DFED8F|nr:thyroid hormone receptor-associated protein 3 isoform X3 [Triplophysa dalaica]